MRNFSDNHTASGSNTLRPDLMSDAERLDEAAGLLALAIVRLRQRRDSVSAAHSRDRGESCLPFIRDQSGHVGPQSTETDHG
ncbi:hypothetical protein RUR49_11465 [Pseudoxanthobacter sp. M-2]|uniref:hypothetical protein n=1 Tax=Pseudoxanthobacter sp. M-2 TaxID=3078754 RepID=UPI0038FCD427